MVDYGQSIFCFRVHMKIKFAVFLILLSTLTSLNVYAQCSPKQNIEVIYDSSGSMLFTDPLLLRLYGVELFL